MQRLVRAGKIITVSPPSHVDPTWTQADLARYANLQARWADSAEDRHRFVECAVWKMKLPGLTYTPAIESKLQQYMPTA
jgi:hypothetical protein